MGFEGVEVVISSVVYRSDEWTWDKKRIQSFRKALGRMILHVRMWMAGSDEYKLG